MNPFFQEKSHGEVPQTPTGHVGARRAHREGTTKSNYRAFCDAGWATLPALQVMIGWGKVERCCSGIIKLPMLGESNNTNLW